MAKEIYIDSNGNENLVSGTINTADMLPITSGSATNTKAYIDNKDIKCFDVTLESYSYTSGNMVRFNVPLDASETDALLRISVSVREGAYGAVICGGGRVGIIPNETATTAVKIRVWHI